MAKMVSLTVAAREVRMKNALQHRLTSDIGKILPGKRDELIRP